MRWRQVPRWTLATIVRQLHNDTLGMSEKLPILEEFGKGAATRLSDLELKQNYITNNISEMRVQCQL